MGTDKIRIARAPCWNGPARASTALGSPAQILAQGWVVLRGRSRGLGMQALRRTPAGCVGLVISSCARARVQPAKLVRNGADTTEVMENWCAPVTTSSATLALGKRWRRYVQTGRARNRPRHPRPADARREDGRVENERAPAGDISQKIGICTRRTWTRRRWMPRLEPVKPSAAIDGWSTALGHPVFLSFNRMLYRLAILPTSVSIDPNDSPGMCQASSRVTRLHRA